MNISQKTSFRIFRFLKNLFASQKSKRPARISAPASNALRSNAGWRSVAGKRAVFFVLLAILVLGFSFSFHIPSAKAWTPTAEDYKKLEPYGTKAEVDQMLAEYPKTQNWYTLATYFPEYANASNQNALAAAANNSSGSSITSALATAALGVIIGVLLVIASFLKMFVYYAALTLDLTLNPTLYSFTSNTMIVQGWTVVRDVCNLLFLLVLLFIAICTILKIEKYHAKKTLLMLIIMALLINFSKPIAIFVFDGSQLLMNFFLSQMGQTGTGATSTVVARASAIAGLVYNTLPPNSGTTQIAIQYLFAVVFLFMLGVAFFVSALMLIIRIVVIMLLIIVSPFAFFAAIVPDFSKMSSQWWSSLFEYSYYGPAAAFFLLLATQLENALPQITKLTNGTSIDATVYDIIHYLVVIVFLYASIFMAKKFGGGAGAAVVGNANRFMKWGGGMTKGGGMWGAGGGAVARVTGAADMYKGVKGGIAKQPGWRMLTKEGREAKSKERQQKWEEKVAPFNISNVKKNAKELENAPKATVDAGVKSGKAEHIFEAARRGDLTAAQLKDSKVRNLMKQNPDFEKAIYKNLRDSGKADVQWDDMHDRGSTTTEAFDKTYKDMSFNNMAEKGNLKKALNTEDVPGSTYDIFHKMDKLKDPTTIKNLQARATDGDTFNVLQKLHDYKIWEGSSWDPAKRPAGFVGAPANLGDFSVYLRS